MKNKQLFIMLTSLVLLLACSTDDTDLYSRNENQIFENLNSSQLSKTKIENSENNEELSSYNSNSDLSEFCSVFPYESRIIQYPSSPYWLLSNYKYARIYRAFLARETIPSGCLRYNIPNIPKLKFRNGVYIEEIEEIEEIIEFEPGSVTDGIEL